MTFTIKNENLPIILDYINEARIELGQSPLDIKDIADEIIEGNLTQKHLRKNGKVSELA